MWEGAGDRTELQHIDLTLLALTALLSRSRGLINRGPVANSAGCWLYLPHLVTNGTGLQSNCLPVLTKLYNSSTLTFLWTSQSHSLNPFMVKVIFWYSMSGCTCYLHRCISYFDSPAGSEVNIQHKVCRRGLGHLLNLSNAKEILVEEQLWSYSIYSLVGRIKWFIPFQKELVQKWTEWGIPSTNSQRCSSFKMIWHAV